MHLFAGLFPQIAQEFELPVLDDLELEPVLPLAIAKTNIRNNTAITTIIVFFIVLFSSLYVPALSSFAAIILHINRSSGSPADLPVFQ